MNYLSSFTLPSSMDRNPNVYPDAVFRSFAGETLYFGRITVVYGNNGSGKSSLLNLMANKLGLAGAERIKSYGRTDYVQRFLQHSRMQLGLERSEGGQGQLPEGSRYIKSEDILYEIKKIQQQAVLREALLFENRNKGMTQEQAETHSNSPAFAKQMGIIQFSQEKYSNGETAMQFFEEHLHPGRLYLLDEPETSLSPANQIKLAEQINELARFLDSQFIIASHSPFMLGTLHAKIYNLDRASLQTAEWHELENVRFFYDFFNKRRALFED